MEHIEEEIVSVDVVDIAVIGKEPHPRPRVQQYECISGKHELRLALHRDYTIDDKPVLAPEIRAELIVRNVSALAGGACPLPLLSGLRWARGLCLLTLLILGWLRLFLSRRLLLRRGPCFALGFLLLWWFGLVAPFILLLRLLCANGDCAREERTEECGTQKSKSFHIVLRIVLVDPCSGSSLRGPCRDSGSSRARYRAKA